MIFDDNKLFKNARTYAKASGRNVLRQDLLGHGTDGAVWKTETPSALKAFYRQDTFLVEHECYRRLKLAGIRQLNGLNVPVLESADFPLRVLEITFVRPPYFLDFGKVRLDRPPDYFYDKQKLANALADWRHLFGRRWPDVAAVLQILRQRFNIHYLDPRPGNVNFGDDDDDDDDWLREPEIDYSDYD